MAAPAPYPGTPRWVKVFGIIVVVLVLLLVGLLLFGGGGTHGPRRHTPSDDQSGGYSRIPTWEAATATPTPLPTAPARSA